MTRDSEAFKKEIAAVEEEIKRLERQEEERAEKQIQLDEEIDVKSKLIEREILQAQKNKKDPDEKEEDKYISPLILRLQEYEMPPATDKNSKADTGYVSAPKVPRISAISFGGMLRETFARHMNARWEHQMETHGFTYKNMFNRMWSMDQVDSGRKEAMTRDLKIIEDRTASRITRMNELSLKKAGGNITVSEERQLRTLEKEEISRYWMRQTLINDLNLPEQEKMNWLRPIGDGAYGVLPFTIVTQWDKLDLSQKGGVRWMYDNVLIRWQRALYGG
ncbi:MAG: hypothetical protein KKD39_01125, partial [Candidatus Altiarchaeota archaeon]|nr:hypothetical protein [Candidatus Altiarchaeota archaeon]